MRLLRARLGLRALARVITPDPSLSLRPLALPTEHGGWGFVLEPLLLGLILAPSVAGVGLAAMALFGFLARHPLKLALADHLRGRSYPRTRAAERLALLYSAAALAGLALAFQQQPDSSFWLPLVAATPLAVAQLAYDARNRGRELTPQLLGAVAPGAMASALVLGRDWSVGAALVLWLIVSLRAAASVLYVRARLRLDRGATSDTGVVWASHLLAVVVLVALAATRQAPWLGVVAFLVLAARAAHGLSSGRGVLRPRALGFREMGFGLLTVLLLTLGYGVAR